MVAVFVALTVAPGHPASECVGLPVQQYKKEADFVFEATVKQLARLDGNELAADLQTYRVWKGNVPETTSVHFASTVDGPNLKPGERYIFFAVAETDRARKDFALAGEAHK